MNFKWTKERVREVCLSCNSRKEFHTKHRRAYNAAVRNNYLDEICSHMIVNTIPDRCVYSYEFSDNSVYIGLTYDIKNRYNRHMNDENSSVNIHMKETKLIPLLKQLTEFIDIEKSKEMENFYLNKYKNDGWNILNKAKTGSVGGITLIWTKEKCLEIARKCENRSEFWDNYSGAVNACKKNGWMKDVHHIIKCKTKEKNYWNNYQNCLNEAIKQKTRTNFRRYGSGAFSSSVKNGWKDKIYEHMNWRKQKS